MQCFFAKLETWAEENYSFGDSTTGLKKDKILCAKYRKGHFEGVLDVMGRLTNLVNPKKIFMGKKDYQQYFLIKKYLKNKCC